MREAAQLKTKKRAKAQPRRTCFEVAVDVGGHLARGGGGRRQSRGSGGVTRGTTQQPGCRMMCQIVRWLEIKRTLTMSVMALASNCQSASLKSRSDLNFRIRAIR